MSDFSDEIKVMLEEIADNAQSGSAELIQYVADRRGVIAEAIAAGGDDVTDIVKQEVLNMKAYSATEAVVQADAVDATVLAVSLKAFAAFDTLLLAYLR